MRVSSRHPPERRRAAEALLRAGDLTTVEIGKRLGVPAGTVAAWNRRAGGLSPRRVLRTAPAAWPSGRREALARLHGLPGVDPGDLAELAGLARRAGPSLVAGLDPPVRPLPDPAVLIGAEAVADPPTLRAHLRAHIARQIAAFDAALKGEGAAVVDSARVLRDLGGLKRLFDELVREEPAPAVGEGSDAGEPDLAGIRAEVARRYARFVGAGAAG